MATSLSTYWVKFFSGAGFPLDVATKHAVVFSNNRIKPDMLPDLDKPSLKEMGITLMGDMIAILRYAKKVSDDMTCERFLVDTADPAPQIETVGPKTIVKKVASKISSVTNKTAISTKPSTTNRDTLKITKTLNSPSVTVTAKKKPVTKVIANNSQALQPRKRKNMDEIVSVDSESDDEWPVQVQKRLKPKNDNDKVGYKVIVPKTPIARVQESKVIKKKILDQKRTVFDRLGDSSVTSTTNLAEANTTFNITGLGSEILKRNSSVFNRLGDKDSNKEVGTAGILKNGSIGNNSNSSSSSGSSNGQPQGILKSRVSNITTITLKNNPLKSQSMKKNMSGTMHADHERSQKVVSTSVKQLVRKTKALNVAKESFSNKITRQMPLPKLASERVGPLPAKARLGLTGSSKQVTFNKVATVAHFKKPGVFSRLGI